MVQKATSKKLLDWYGSHSRDLPWRKTDDPYAIFISEIMLQQTQVSRVIPRYKQFLEKFPNWESLAKAPAGTVIRAWDGLGYNRRVIRLQATARKIVGCFGGNLPSDPCKLRELEGVGRYTAAAVACFAFGAASPVIDTNVRRVIGRLLFGPRRIAERDITSAVRDAIANLPCCSLASWTQALMDLGATVCTSSQPRCNVCPLNSTCAATSAFDQPTERKSLNISSDSSPRKPFHGSSRYYRGRIVQHLRTLSPGKTIDLTELGAALINKQGEGDLQWLYQMITQLANEGLVWKETESSMIGRGNECTVRIRLP